MSYAAVVAALRDAIRNGVPDLNDVLTYVPRTPQVPLVYLTLEGFDRPKLGQLTGMKYTIVATLLLSWQDFEQAEQSLWPYVNSLPAAVDADATLGGAVNVASVTRGEAGWTTVGAGTQNPITYRHLKVFVEATEKAPYRSGI